MTKRRSTALAAALLLTLIPILFVLSGSLCQLRLAPAASGLDRANLSSPTTSAGAYSGGSLPGFDVFRILVPLALVCFVLAAISSIRRREFRKELALGLCALALILLVRTLIPLLADGERNQLDVDAVSTRSESETPEESSGSSVAEAPSPHEAVWAVALTVALSAALLVCSITLLVMKRGSRRPARARPPPELNELAACAEEAADRIRFGDDAGGAVRRCYARMSKILSRRMRIDETYLTPREFADSLERVGIASEHVVRLTGMFELVRYGRRPEDRFTEEAIACLGAIRVAYGSPTEAE
jgi:hypothetical protein